MKLSIASTFLIIIAAGFFSWQKEQKFSLVSQEKIKLIEQAKSLGISTDVHDASFTQASALRKADEVVKKPVDIKKLTTDFIAFAKEVEEMEKNGDTKNRAEIMKKAMTFLDQLTALDTTQLKEFLQAIRDTKELKDETKKGMMAFAMFSLISEHPKEAIKLYTESKDLFGDGMDTYEMSQAINNWAKKDASAAVEWMKANEKKFPDLVTEDTKYKVLSAVAANDPTYALKLIKEFGLKKQSNALQKVFEAVKTPEQKMEMLTYLRDTVQKMPDDNEAKDLHHDGVESLAFGKHYGEVEFDSTSKWIADAKLSPAELDDLTDNLDDRIRSGEQGKWIDWLGKSSLDDKTKKTRIANVVSYWTEKDYQAAGKYLATAPDDGNKSIAVRAYAEKVYPYDPENALQWIKTVSNVTERQSTYQNIYKKLPKNSDAEKQAAENFKKEYGVK